jgi:hypothetical protein
VNPSEREQKHIDVLLASYREKKAEIARRSQLSWAAIAGYFVFLSVAGSAIGERKHLLAWPLSVWLLSGLVYLFVYSQYCVIMGLSNNIKDKIEEQLKASLPESVLLGERDSSGWPMARLLLVGVFIGAPILATIFAAYQGGPCYLLLATGSSQHFVSRPC